MATTAPQPVRLQAFTAFWLVAAAGLLAAIFWPTFQGLIEIWSIDPNYSHGFAVLPICIGLAYWRATKAGWPLQEQVDLVLGGLCIAAGCFVHLVTLVIGWLLIDWVALVLVLRGVTLTLGGRKWASNFNFPIFFSFFMFQLPVPWTGLAALWLQDFVAAVSGAILETITVSYRTGNYIYMAGAGHVTVAQECSGLRQVVAFVALGTLVGYVLQKPMLFRILLVILAVPVAVLANVIRVLLMALGVKYFGSDWLTGWMHDIPAMITLPLGLALFVLVGWGLDQFWAKKTGEASCNSTAA